MKTLFLIASFFTDPICKAHEGYWFDKALGKNLSLRTVLYFVFGIIIAPIGILIRYIARMFQRVPYLYMKGNLPEKVNNKDVSLLTWNVCCISAGYAVTDGGLYPWEYRIERIVQKVLEQKADVVCLMEVFDIHASKYIATRLRKTYTHVYYNIGPKALGVSAGFVVASKLPISDTEFIRYPKTHLVGRTKNAAKGVFGFTVPLDHKRTHIFLSHLQHSEECEFPTKDEVFAREGQVKIIFDQVKKSHHQEGIILTGDLNFDEEEFLNSSWADQADRGIFPPEKTWRGDEFCAKLVGKKVSSGLTYDYTMTLGKSSLNIVSSYVETGYDPKVFNKEALSDHLGVLSVISLKGEN